MRFGLEITSLTNINSGGILYKYGIVCNFAGIMTDPIQPPVNEYQGGYQQNIFRERI